MKLNFMLIDDNNIDLFINQKIIENSKILSNIRAFTSANSAVKYLKGLEENTGINNINVPDVIFLDINMPEMSGFQFIREFNKLKIEKMKSIKIYMLSSSTYFKDVQKVKQEKTCIGYIVKPLTKETIDNVLSEFNMTQTA